MRNAVSRCPDVATRTRPRRVAWLGALVLGLALAGAAPGAASAGPKPAQLDKVRAGELAVVLVNLRGSIDGKPLTRLGSPVSNNVFAGYLASLDRLDAPKAIDAEPLSRQAAAAGWYYWLLPPGLYHLLVLPPGLAQNPPAAAYHVDGGRFGRLTQYAFAPGRGASWSADMMAYVFDGAAPPDFVPLDGFWFEVPAHGQVVYLGSVAAACKAGRGLFGSLIDSCSDFEVTSDPQAARQLAAAVFPDLEFAARALTPYGEPPPGSQLRGPGATMLLVETPAGIAPGPGGPDLDSPAVIHGTGDAILVYNLLAVTFELASRAQDRRRAEDAAARLKPCMERLAATLDPASHRPAFLAALGEALGPGALEAKEGEAGDATRLLVRAPALRLVESGGPERLAAELVLDVRLQDATSHDTRYYALWSYGPALPALNPFVPRSPLYTRRVPERAQARPADEWCGDGGAALLKQEVDTGLGHIAAQVARDLAR